MNRISSDPRYGRPGAKRSGNLFVSALQPAGSCQLATVSGGAGDTHEASNSSSRGTKALMGRGMGYVSGQFTASCGKGRKQKAEGRRQKENGSGMGVARG